MNRADFDKQWKQERVTLATYSGQDVKDMCFEYMQRGAKDMPRALELLGEAWLCVRPSNPELDAKIAAFIKEHGK